MKRRDLLSYLRTHDCAELREGARHSIWQHISTGKMSTIPRHSEINNNLVKKICKDLGVEIPSSF
ncbi:MAG: type II toxin-antitoxin system HicA family toxin [Ignavibacteriae bacterium]|nr:MAG: type II toxin-antitoxin system HicA family toxin [Ignavibacteriota bacterium]